MPSRLAAAASFLRPFPSGGRWRRALCSLVLLACTSAAALAQNAPRPEALLVFDPDDALSSVDARGIREALAEQRTPLIELPLAAGVEIPALILEQHPVLVLAQRRLAPADIARVQVWVGEGGGLVASGAAGLDLQTLLGIKNLRDLSRFPPDRPPLDEIRFGLSHPVATGSFWTGPISQVPPMPASELPVVPQLLYRLQWPAYTATAEGALVLARWRSSNSAWTTADVEPAVFAAASGQGRAVYFGALPGTYADWNYPLGWRMPVQEAVSWVNTRAPQVQLGHWPQARRAAYAFTADTERAPMRSVVPALLSMFQQLGLSGFGTFFMVGQAGGDVGSEGAVENPAIVRAILDAGAELAGHGDVHSVIRGQDLTTQTARLTSMRTLIETSTEDVPPVRGFRAPALLVDFNTWRAVAAAGLAYDSSDQDVWCECGLPWFTGEVWSLPPSAPMDYVLVDQFGLSGNEISVLMRDKAAFVASRRGLFNWVTHPWILSGYAINDPEGQPSRENLLPMVASVLGAARDDGGFWMQRLDRILDWWVQRESLSIEIVDSDRFRLQLRLRNAGEQAVEQASLWLRLPPAGYPWGVELEGVAQSTLSRPHGLGASTPFSVLVVPRIEAKAAVDVELRVLRPDAVFADGFEN